METLTPLGDAPPNFLATPHVEEAVFALVTVAEALSRAAQAIAEAAQAIPSAILALDSLSGLEVIGVQPTPPPRDTPTQSQMDENLGSGLIPASEPVMGGKCTSSERNDEIIRDEGSDSSPQRLSNADKQSDTPLPRIPSPDSPSVYPELTQESNNKCEIEPSPSQTELDLPTTGAIIPGPAPQTNIDSNHEDDLSDLKSLAQARPKLPPGRNYVRLDRYSETPFIACMALQSNKTICIIHTRMSLSLYAKIFKSITKLEVTYPENTDRMSSVEDSLRVLTQAFRPMMLLLAHDSLSDALLKWAEPDCVIHWGLPSDLYGYVKQISLLKRTTRSCLVLPPDDGVDTLTSMMFNYGVVAYPIAVQEAYFSPDSLFQKVSILSAPALSSVDLKEPSLTVGTKAESGSTAPSSSGAPIASTASTSKPIAIPQPIAPQSRTSCPLPQGHYYIVLNEPLDAVPLISYLATYHRKALCYLSVSDANSGTAYQQLFNRTTNIPTTYCSVTKPKKLGPAMSAFGGMQSAFYLRPANDTWDSCLKKSHTNCLIYWGLPDRIEHYISQCQLKVAHSYMIITPSQSTQLTGQKSGKLRAHPSRNLFNDGKNDSVLHDMRQKTENALSNISNPPISVSRYKALMKRRNPQSGTSA